MSQIYGTGKSNIKGIIAGILLIGGFMMAALANQWAISERLIGFTSQKWKDRVYHRLWFTQDGSLVGATASGAELTVERFSRSGSESEKWMVNLGRVVSPADLQSDWVVDGEAQRLAYAGPKGLVVRPLCEPGAGNCAGNRLDLPVGPNSILAFAFVPGRMVAAMLNDSTVLLWDTETGNQTGRIAVPMDNPDQARWQGDYLAVVSSAARSARLFRLSAGLKLNMVEEARTPHPPFQLITPGTGQVGYLSPGGLYYRGETRNSPGPVRSAVLGSSDMVVAGGDFDGLVVLGAKENHYPLLEQEEEKIRANTVASNGSRFAYSGPNGTGLVGLTTETRITPSGRKFNFIGLGLALLGGLLAASGLLFDFVGMSFKAKGVSKKSRKSLLDPDPTLVKALSDGQVVLWAGAGLSAQAGFPTRNRFLLQTLQTADSETWLEPARLIQMYELVNQGKQEQVLDDLIETLHYQRAILVAHFKVVYSRFTPMSACHKLIRRLPVSAAVTTNYDGCLEMLGPMWANNAVTLKDGAHRGAVEKDQFFLLRLYGDPKVPAKAILSHREFAAAVKADSTLGDTLQKMFDSKTMLFVGCSAEGLVADLKLMPKIRKNDQKHVAIIGVGDGQWERQVQTLEKEYGITCLVCAEETIATELPKFLEKLATEVESASGDKKQRPAGVKNAFKKAANG